MKKVILISFTIIAIIVTIICVKYYSYKKEYNKVLKENSEIEKYTEKEIYGIELGTIINKSIDKNIKNSVEKDDKGIFIANEENSIKIQIYMQDNEQTYDMETIYNSDMKQFIQYYGNIKFKCSKIEYHKNTKKIKYLLFEQIATS